MIFCFIWGYLLNNFTLARSSSCALSQQNITMSAHITRRWEWCEFHVILLPQNPPLPISYKPRQTIKHYLFFGTNVFHACVHVVVTQNVHHFFHIGNFFNIIVNGGSTAVVRLCFQFYLVIWWWKEWNMGAFIIFFKVYLYHNILIFNQSVKPEKNIIILMKRRGWSWSIFHIAQLTHRTQKKVDQ